MSKRGEVGNRQTQVCTHVHMHMCARLVKECLGSCAILAKICTFESERRSVGVKGGDLHCDIHANF